MHLSVPKEKDDLRITKNYRGITLTATADKVYNALLLNFIKLPKNATCCFEQILKATPHKTAVIWPLTSHLKNYPNKMNKICGTLLRKQGQTHKQSSSMDSYTWHFMDIGYSLEDLPGMVDERDRWGEREQERNSCSQCNLMIMMIYYEICISSNVILYCVRVGDGTVFYWTFLFSYNNCLFVQFYGIKCSWLI